METELDIFAAHFDHYKNNMEISKASDEIVMALINTDKPVETIMKLYDRADDKDIFVAALAAMLLLRHKQWQALAQARREYELR